MVRLASGPFSGAPVAASQLHESLPLKVQSFNWPVTSVWNCPLFTRNPPVDNSVPGAGSTSCTRPHSTVAVVRSLKPLVGVFVWVNVPVQPQQAIFDARRSGGSSPFGLTTLALSAELFPRMTTSSSSLSALASRQKGTPVSSDICGGCHSFHSPPILASSRQVAPSAGSAEGSFGSGIRGTPVMTAPWSSPVKVRDDRRPSKNSTVRTLSFVNTKW